VTTIGFERSASPNSATTTAICASLAGALAYARPQAPQNASTSLRLQPGDIHVQRCSANKPPRTRSARGGRSRARAGAARCRRVQQDIHQQMPAGLEAEQLTSPCASARWR
jgi:hypothetical protein